MVDARDLNLGDVINLSPKTGSSYLQGVIVDFSDEVSGDIITYIYSIRLPDDSLVEATPDEFQKTGESVLLFQPDEVVRIRKSDAFPELVGADGIVCAFGEIAPREFTYAVYIPHLERVYSMFGADLESLGRFETLF